MTLTADELTQLEAWNTQFMARFADQFTRRYTDPPVPLLDIHEVDLHRIIRDLLGTVRALQAENARLQAQGGR